MLVKFFKKFLSIKQDREQLIKNASQEAENIVLRARQEAMTTKSEAEKKREN